MTNDMKVKLIESLVSSLRGQQALFENLTESFTELDDSYSEYLKGKGEGYKECADLIVALIIK